jgi:hypothetical protein
MQAYCITCRTKREMRNPKTIKTENGQPAIKALVRNVGQKCTE